MFPATFPPSASFPTRSPSVLTATSSAVPPRGSNLPLIPTSICSAAADDIPLHDDCPGQRLGQRAIVATGDRGNGRLARCNAFRLCAFADKDREKNRLRGPYMLGCSDAPMLGWRSRPRHPPTQVSLHVSRAPPKIWNPSGRACRSATAGNGIYPPFSGGEGTRRPTNCGRLSQLHTQCSEKQGSGNQYEFVLHSFFIS